MTVVQACMDPKAIHAISRPHRRLLWLYIVRCIFTGPLFPIAFLPSLFKYETLKYRFDDEGVAMSWGLLWRHETYLTYARIQDIHLSRGLLERWFGLATIEIQTASGSATAEMSIVGLMEYEAVRDYLYSRMRGARFGETAPAEAAPAKGAPEDAAAVLAEIRDELRAIREALARRGAPPRAGGTP
jgi:putative membrane protein